MKPYSQYFRMLVGNILYLSGCVIETIETLTQASIQVRPIASSIGGINADARPLEHVSQRGFEVAEAVMGNK